MKELDDNIKIFEDIKSLKNGEIIIKKQNKKDKYFEENDKIKKTKSFEYEKIEEKNGVYIVSKSKINDINNNLYGVINKKGKEIIPIEYNKCIVKDNYIIVSKDNKGVKNSTEIYTKDGKLLEYFIDK